MLWSRYKEMTEAELTENDAQGDYEAMMKDSDQKRAEDFRSMTDKQGGLAELETGFGWSCHIVF